MKSAISFTGPRVTGQVYYLAVVCGNDVLEKRMRIGRAVQDENWIKSSADFNNRLMLNTNNTMPQITLLDTSGIALSQAAATVDDWISKNSQMLK